MKAIYVASIILITSSFSAISSEYRIQIPAPGMISHENKVESCLKIIKKNPGSKSGIYSVLIEGNKRDVYCDMNTQGGGWMLYNDYGSDISREKAINSMGINSIPALEASGHRHDIDHVNHSTIHIHPKYMQFFYYAGKSGYIELDLPNYASEVMIGLSTQWYGYSNEVTVGGALVHTKPAYESHTDLVFDYKKGDTIRVTEVSSGVSWIDAVWVR